MGFCLVIRREVVERIGSFDERFGVGCFEDDDFCRRALQAGYRAVIAEDAFVHHFGTRTFLGSGIDLNVLLRENEKKYAAKWADTASTADPKPEVQRVDKPGTRFGIKKSPTGGLLLTNGEVDPHIRLSLCMIVRDNAGTIGPCLESIRPWVDEMIVVDTGSQDRTPQIAAELGARVYHFPWCDDFSGARNESLKFAKGEWIFWMDSDDTITPECGRGLRALVDGPHDPPVLGYVMQVHCPGAEIDGHHSVTVVDHVKLFRNGRDLEFEGRIHEQIIPAIRRAGGDVEFTDLFVVHSGADQTAEGNKRKWKRDIRILLRELDERPNHPFVLFNLGMTYADGRRYEKAIKFLREDL